MQVVDERDALMVAEANAIGAFVAKYRNTEEADTEFLLRRLLDAANRQEKVDAIREFRKQMLIVGHNEGWHGRSVTPTPDATITSTVEPLCAAIRLALDKLPLGMVGTRKTLHDALDGAARALAPRSDAQEGQS